MDIVNIILPEDFADIINDMGAVDYIHLKYEERGKSGVWQTPEMKEESGSQPGQWTKHVKTMHRLSTRMKIMYRKVVAVAAIMICCISCHREGPTVAEEICQVRDSLLDKNMACVCFYPPECRTLTPG